MERVFVEIAGVQVPLVGEDCVVLSKSPMFINWASSIDPEFVVKEIQAQSVDLVGPEGNKRVLFAKIKADVTDKKGNPVGGIAFLRGGTVAILMVFKCIETRQKYVVLTEQHRFPIGKAKALSLPAGMLDGDGNFAFVAAKEIEEEVGITIEQDHLTDMTEMVYPDLSGVSVSSGGTDEFMKIFLYEREVSKFELVGMQLHNKETGAEDENERIVVKLLPFKSLMRAVPTLTSLSAIALYNELRGNDV